MAGEKRTQDQEEALLSESVILVDIEGTTTSISFVKETLFPYVRENLKKYIATKWEDEEFKKDYEKLKEQAKKDEEDKVEGFVPIKGTNPDEERDSLVKNVLWQMDGDRKTGALKQLQGHMWREAYKSGAVKAHVYDDVPKAFESWVKDGKRIFVYSSGSVEAQKLLFGHSVHGDLLKNFSGFYDTEIGAKQDSSSYKNILSKIPTDASNVIFLTDVVKEAKAAKEAGLSTVIVVRDGNAPLTDEDKITYTTIKSFLDLTFQTSAKRQKLDTSADSKEDAEKSLPTNVCEPMDTSEDVEMRDCTDRKEETRKSESNEATQPAQDESMANESTGAAGATTTTATATTMTAGTALTTSTATTTSSAISSSSEEKPDAKDKVDETSGTKDEPMVTESSDEKQTDKKDDSSSASTTKSAESSTDKVSDRIGTESSTTTTEKTAATGSETESAVQSSTKNKVSDEKATEKTAEAKEDERTKQQQSGTEKLAAGCESMDITVAPEAKSKSAEASDAAAAATKTENKSDKSTNPVKNMETVADVPMVGTTEESKVLAESKSAEDKMSCEAKSEVSEKQQHTKGDEQPAKAEAVVGGNSNGSIPSSTGVADLISNDDVTMKPAGKDEPSTKIEAEGTEAVKPAITSAAVAAASVSTSCTKTAKNGGMDVAPQEKSTQSATQPSDSAAPKDTADVAKKGDEKSAMEKSTNSKEVSTVEKDSPDVGEKKAADNDDKNVKKDETQAKVAGAKEKTATEGNAVGTDTQQGCDISTVAAAAALAAAAAAAAVEASSSKDSPKEETATSVTAAATSKSAADEEKDTSKVADAETKKVNGTAQNGETTSNSGTTNSSANSISNSSNTTASTTTATATTTISSSITTATTTSSSSNNNNNSSSVPVSDEKLHRNGLNEESAGEKLDTAKVDDTSAQNGEPQSSSEASSAESIKVRKVVDSAVADGAGEPDVVPPVVVAATS